MCEWGNDTILIPPSSLGITHYDGTLKMWIAVDTCLAPVIRHLWDSGVITLNCCCGHGKSNPSIVLESNLSEAAVAEIRMIIAEVDSREFELYSWMAESECDE